MKGFKGTKGDWEVNGYPRLTVQSKSDEICLINPNMGNDVAQANTQLIASAPELLKALQMALKSIDEWEKKDPKSHHKLMSVDTYIKMQQAIHKALGE